MTITLKEMYDTESEYIQNEVIRHSLQRDEETREAHLLNVFEEMV